MMRSGGPMLASQASALPPLAPGEHFLQDRAVGDVAPDQPAGDRPGDPVPHIVRTRPAADLDRVGFARFSVELGDLVAVVPGAAVADLVAAAVEDLQIQID